MVSADVARLVLAGLHATFHDQFGVAYAVAFGVSAGSSFFKPAAGSLLPSVVGDDQLVAANSARPSDAVSRQYAPDRRQWPGSWRSASTFVSEQSRTVGTQLQRGRRAPAPPRSHRKPILA